jgi:arsenate reductase-like glutaredoxin family protein
MALQLFGTRKCQETRKAERWLKERGIAFHFRDVADKPASEGELESIARAVGGFERLIDEKSRAFADAGLSFMEYEAKGELVARPAIMRTPILRDGPKAIAGFDARAYDAFVRGA